MTLTGSIPLAATQSPTVGHIAAQHDGYIHDAESFISHEQRLSQLASYAASAPQAHTGTAPTTGSFHLDDTHDIVLNPNTGMLAISQGTSSTNIMGDLGLATGERVLALDAILPGKLYAITTTTGVKIVNINDNFEVDSVSPLFTGTYDSDSMVETSLENTASGQVVHVIAVNGSSVQMADVDVSASTLVGIDQSVDHIVHSTPVTTTATSSNPTSIVEFNNQFVLAHVDGTVDLIDFDGTVQSNNVFAATQDNDFEAVDFGATASGTPSTFTDVKLLAFENSLTIMGVGSNGVETVVTNSDASRIQRKEFNTVDNNHGTFDVTHIDDAYVEGGKLIYTNTNSQVMELTPNDLIEHAATSPATPVLGTSTYVESSSHFGTYDVDLLNADGTNSGKTVTFAETFDGRGVEYTDTDSLVAMLTGLVDMTSGSAVAVAPASEPATFISALQAQYKTDDASNNDDNVRVLTTATLDPTTPTGVELELEVTLATGGVKRFVITSDSANGRISIQEQDEHGTDVGAPIEFGGFKNTLDSLRAAGQAGQKAFNDLVLPLFNDQTKLPSEMLQIIDSNSGATTFQETDGVSTSVIEIDNKGVHIVYTMHGDDSTGRV